MILMVKNAHVYYDQIQKSNLPDITKQDLEEDRFSIEKREPKKRGKQESIM